MVGDYKSVLCNVVLGIGAVLAKEKNFYVNSVVEEIFAMLEIKDVSFYTYPLEAELEFYVV